MVEIRGYIENLCANKEYKDFISGISNKEEFIMSMIDAPIVHKGKAIGVINDVDLNEGTWYGVLWEDMAVDVDLCGEYISSLQLIK